MNSPSTAIWALTPNGARLAGIIARELSGAQLFSGRSVTQPPEKAICFDRLADTVAREFNQYEAHIFIMAAGIAVRMIAPHIHSKTADPPVVVVDDAGCFAISLLSGHLGGGNELATKVARAIDATPVTTTATDHARVPAIDLLAKQYGLQIENPGAIKSVSMAFLTRNRVWRQDPYQILDDVLDEWTVCACSPDGKNGPGIRIGHELVETPEQVLILRPKSLVVGMGCNRGTSAQELINAVRTIFQKYRLSLACIRQIATINDKLTEPGLCAMADHYKRRLTGFSKIELSSVKDVPNPSAMVEKHMGVKSVCEAAAILAANNGTLVVPKQKTGNVTMAVASMSWASGPGMCPT